MLMLLLHIWVESTYDLSYLFAEYQLVIFLLYVLFATRIFPMFRHNFISPYMLKCICFLPCRVMICVLVQKTRPLWKWKNRGSRQSVSSWSRCFYLTPCMLQLSAIIGLHQVETWIKPANLSLWEQHSQPCHRIHYGRAGLCRVPTAHGKDW